MDIDAINERSGQAVDAAMRVHSALGPGLMESAYEACMAYELRKRGLRVATQLALPVVYAEVRIELGYRVDLLVDDVSTKPSCCPTSGWGHTGLGC
jgi:GxxExxY protein